jgi:tetratricopeptide (TPR) repeat protein
LVSCYIHYEIAVGLKTPRDIKAAINLTKACARKNKGVVFQRLAMKASALKGSATQRTASKPKRSSKKQTLKEKFKTGIALAKKKQYRKALPVLEECYEQKSNHNSISYSLAIVYRKLGHKKKAIKLCNEILGRDQDHKKAKKLLAFLQK